MKYTIVASLAAILCLLGAIPLVPSSAQEAQDIPPLPHAFYGNVTINGTPAANGTVVEARGTGVSTGIEGNPITVTEAGKYGGPGGFDPKLVVQGDITDRPNLTFYVNNVTAQCYDVQAGGEWLDSYPFDSGNVTELNLRVGPTYNLTVNVTPSGGGNVTVDGTMLSDYPNSTMWYCGTNVTLNATAATGYSFVNWSGDLSDNTTPVNITMDSNKNVTANFAVTYNLTVTSDGCCPIDVTGAVNGTVPAGGNLTFTGIAEGENVTVSADDSGVCCELDSWSDGGAKTHNITMDSDKSVTAYCSVPTYNLTVNVTPSGGGNVTVNGVTPPGYPNTTTWTCGVNVTLNATAAGGYNFSHWSGDLSGNTTPVNITMNSTKNVTAYFGMINVTHNLTVNVTPSGGGDIEVNGDAPGSYPYNYTFNDGDLVDLNAVPAGGYSFVNWSGNLSGSTNPTNITMYDNYTIMANFEAAPDISVSPTIKNFGSIKVGASSSPQTFNVSNVGNADLVVGTINITGTNANQFTIQNDNVSNQTIIPGGSATLQVVFSPTSTGAKSATLNISSNDPDEATVLVPLSGTGKTVAAGPGGGGGVAYYLRVNMFGDISKWKISKQGNLLESLQVSSADDKVTISLDKSASCLDKEDNRLSTITISNQTDWPPVAEDYDIIGTAYEFQPAGAKFAPALSLTLGYEDNDVPQYLSEEDVYIAYYDATAENWVPLTSQVDTENNIVDAAVSHFTTFAIMGAAVPPTPANFSVTSLDLSSEQVEPGQEVLVTVNVTNIGGCEDSYALDLTINGAVEQTKTVTLAPSASDTVTFTVIKEEPGSYTISVDGLTKEFSVAAPSWLSRYWWTILVGIVIIGPLAYFLWSRRKVRS